MAMLGSRNLDEIFELGEIISFVNNYFLSILSLDFNSLLKYFKHFQDVFFLILQDKFSRVGERFLFG